MASSSVLTSTSPQPLSAQCMRAPPSSSSVTFSPITISAMRGEPRYMLAFLSTITTMSQNAGMYAPPAAEGPKSLKDLTPGAGGSGLNNAPGGFDASRLLELRLLEGLHSAE